MACLFGKQRPISITTFTPMIVPFTLISVHSL
jgi:hypothetical protein